MGHGFRLIKDGIRGEKIDPISEFPSINSPFVTLRLSIFQSDYIYIYVCIFHYPYLFTYLLTPYCILLLVDCIMLYSCYKGMNV